MQLDRGPGPRPGVRRSQRRQDRPGCRRAIQGVEVDPGRAPRQEIGALEGRIGDPELGNRFRVVGAPVQLALELARDRRAAHLGEALDLAVVRDRHDPRHDRHAYAGSAGVLDEVEVEIVVEEQLRDQEARPGVLLGARVAQVAVAVGRVGVDLGEASGAYAEVEALLDQADQLDRVVEPARVRAPLGLAARRVAAQGQHVLDARGLDLLEDLDEALAGLADAGEVRHRLDAEVLLDPPGQLDGAAAGGAAGAVGHRHVVRRVVTQHLQRALERLLALVRLGREELEGEDRTALYEELGYAHGANLNTIVSRLVDVEASGVRGAAAELVLDVDLIVLPVVAPQPQEDRGPAAQAEPLLLERPAEAELAVDDLVVRALLLLDPVHEHPEGPFGAARELDAAHARSARRSAP